MKTTNHDETRDVVRKYYKDIAVRSSNLDIKLAKTTCCGEQPTDQYSQSLGYTMKNLAELPGQANLGLGCGNPTAFSGIEPGETVLDLGSGGGMDAFIAAKLVGENGKVIGVDMTAEMISLARKNAAKGDYPQVEFRQGFIEDLPVSSNSVDLVISNCVINLSPDKAQVYNEIFRVMRPGGRIAISDPVRIGDFTEDILASDDALCGCVSGAASQEELETYLTDAGFTNISIKPEGVSKEVIDSWMSETESGSSLGDIVISMMIRARKPE